MIKNKQNWLVSRPSIYIYQSLIVVCSYHAYSLPPP